MFRTFAALLMLVVLAGCQAQPLVVKDAWVERVATGFKFTEGPASDGQALYFTDIPNERIIRYDYATDQVSVFREDSGKANGLMFNHGSLFVCEGGNRRVTKFTGDEMTILATSYPFGRRLNSPNDLVVDNAGGVYFTDPRYGKRTDMEMTSEAVYYISPAGELSKLIDNLQRPNGIILSPKASTLYVADNAAKRIYAYTITKPGQITNGRVFGSMDPNANGGPDGMTVDSEGRLYAAGQGAIWVYGPKGDLIAQIPVPEEPSNVTFGGPNNDTLYITARTSLYRLKMNAQGVR
jgi:gluconolactonase